MEITTETRQMNGTHCSQRVPSDAIRFPFANRGGGGFRSSVGSQCYSGDLALEVF